MFLVKHRVEPVVFARRRLELVVHQIVCVAPDTNLQEDPSIFAIAIKFEFPEVFFEMSKKERVLCFVKSLDLP